MTPVTPDPVPERTDKWCAFCPTNTMLRDCPAPWRHSTVRTVSVPDPVPVREALGTCADWSEPHAKDSNSVYHHSIDTCINWTPVAPTVEPPTFAVFEATDLTGEQNG